MSDLENWKDEYAALIQPLKNISEDTANKKFMTNSELMAYNFDKIKGWYTKKLGRGEGGIHSADALWVSLKKELYIFIEFKNGRNFSGADIRNKMRDSLLLFCDIADKHINFTRDFMEYIVVYNITSKPIRDEEDTYIQACGYIRESQSRDLIKDYFLKKGKSEFVRWGLEKYIGIYFKNVHTYSEEEFDKYLNTQMK